MMQINRVLIIGVKSPDSIQCQALNERINNQVFMILPPLFGKKNKIKMQTSLSITFFHYNLVEIGVKVERDVREII